MAFPAPRGRGGRGGYFGWCGRVGGERAVDGDLLSVRLERGPGLRDRAGRRAGWSVGACRHVCGVMSDGQTYGYYSVGGIWEAPVMRGAAVDVNVADGVGYPVMSGNGSAFLDVSAAASGGAWVMEYRAGPGPSTAQMVLDTNVVGMQMLGGGGLSYGWSGSTALTVHWTADGTWICVGGQDGDYCGPDAATARSLGANTSVQGPDGSPDGSQIVAVRSDSSSSWPSIVLFDARTGALVRTLVPARAGVGYVTPRFSPDGTAIVFQAFGDDVQESRIETVAIDGGPVRTVAEGSDPSCMAPETAVHARRCPRRP